MEKMIPKEEVLKWLSKDERIVYIQCLEDFTKGNFDVGYTIKQLEQRAKIRSNIKIPI